MFELIKKRFSPKRRGGLSSNMKEQFAQIYFYFGSEESRSGEGSNYGANGRNPPFLWFQSISS